MAQQLFMDLAAHPQAILDAMDEMRLTIEKIEHQQRVVMPIIFIGPAVLLGIAGLILANMYDSSFLPVVAFILAAGLLIYYFFIRPKKKVRQRFEAAYRIIHTLRDDAGRKGLLVGRLDLSLPNEKTKIYRTARSSSGNTKNYYRDPWFVAKMKLVDGNVVKLTLEDRIKEKKGSFVYHFTQWQNKVVVNPDLYQLESSFDDPMQPVMLSTGQQRANELKVEMMLEQLKAIYSRVKPVEAAIGGEPAVGGDGPSAPQGAVNYPVDGADETMAGAQPI